MTAPTCPPWHQITGQFNYYSCNTGPNQRCKIVSRPAGFCTSALGAGSDPCFSASVPAIPQDTLGSSKAVLYAGTAMEAGQRLGDVQLGPGKLVHSSVGNKVGCIYESVDQGSKVLVLHALE